jgi:hypothetical protein
MIPRDAIEAMPDALAERWGVRAKLPHPLARDLLERPLSAVAIACGQAAFAAQGSRGNHDIACLGRGLTTSDFKNSLSDAARRLAILRYEEAAEHRLLCADQEVKTFRETSFPNADIELELDIELDGANERKTSRIVYVAGQSANLSTYARNLLVSREVVVNDDVDMLGGVFGAIGTAAARTEAQLFSALLESNSTLADGAPMFAAGNVVAEALSTVSLGVAMEKLRAQVTPAGNLANNRAFGIAVAPGLELTAYTIIEAAGLDLVVVCLPWLAAGRWYLLASPKVAPVVGRLVLDGSKNGPILVGPTRTERDVDGVLLAAAADLGMVALGRVGVVRGGA